MPVKKNVVKLEKLIVTEVPIDSIKPNDYNPNRQSDREFELLLRSIEEDGFTQPVLAHEVTKEIVDGEHRWRACKILGWQTIPVVFVNMTKEQMMISTLRHNRARGSENINLAADVLRDLQRLGAIDHAADSLLLDDVELRIMLEDIPQAELVLRNPGEKLSVQDVQQQLNKEKMHEAVRKEADVATREAEQNRIYTLMFKYYAYEMNQIRKCFELLPGVSTGDKIIYLCGLYRQDPAAAEYMAQPDEAAWEPKG